MEYLPGYVANVAPQVDGIVALDDGSSDGSAEFLESSEAILEVLRRPQDRPAWDEPGNYRALVDAGLRHGAEWLVSLDADERLERDFRTRAERVIRRGRLLGLEAFAPRLRELWGTPHQFRADGIWGTKAVGRLFRARADHRFDTRPLHGPKLPLQAVDAGRFALADLEIYHLRMVREEDRVARQRRYEDLDPEALWQPGIGYAYLTDETRLRLKPIAPGREYVE
jgi:glycosyltransferase involved in cell wall biosynthesis